MSHRTITRREFARGLPLIALSAATAPLLSGCIHGTEPLDPTRDPEQAAFGDRNAAPDAGRDRSVDLVLSGDEYRDAEAVRSQFQRLRAMSQDPPQRLRIAFPVGTGAEVLEVGIVSGGAARYRHVRLVRESTGEVTNLLWGREGIYPSIKLTDDRGKTIVVDGRPLEFSFGSVRRSGTGPRSWLELGIKIAALALLVWLGASIPKPIVAAIAFIAFNAMVIGIVIAGVALFVALIHWILGVTGWTLEDVAAFFRRTVEELVQFLAGVVTATGSYRDY